MSSALPLLIAGRLQGPHIDWAALSPIVALSAGALVVLLAGLVRQPGFRATVVPSLSALTLVVTIILAAARIDHPRSSVVAGALAMDGLALVLTIVFSASALAAVLMSWRAHAAAEAGQGEYHALLLFSVLGMAVLVAAQNLVTLFLGLELLSIPLYVMCASESRREGSLESGLKYLIVGSLGSATLVYGLAMIYGASGSTDFSGIAHAIGTAGILDDPLLLTGIGLVVVGLAFKASVAPFHQWTPDVYEGAPTPVTAFMATATKAAALGVAIRFFDVAVIGQQTQWAPVLATLATITIIVGNVGALGQHSLKRMLAYSGVAQAGYMLGGIAVGTKLGVNAIVFYLATYLFMNIAAFAVIASRERESDDGDDLRALSGLGARRPGMAGVLTVAMLSLAGLPATVGFVGKLYLIQALVGGDYTWLAVVLVIGSMLSLGYYLRVVATMWMSREGYAGAGAPGVMPAIAGGSPELDQLARGEQAAPAIVDGGSPDVGTGDFEVAAVAVVFGAASIFFGIFPTPLVHFAAHAGQAISGLF